MTDRKPSAVAPQAGRLALRFVFGDMQWFGLPKTAGYVQSIGRVGGFASEFKVEVTLEAK